MRKPDKTGQRIGITFLSLAIVIQLGLSIFWWVENNTRLVPVMVIAMLVEASIIALSIARGTSDEVHE